jgi:hypothetical protein
MMGKFGWSYPPGCSGPPYDYEGPCEVCGKSVDDCTCPECPVCSDIGNPDCYEKHGLIRTQEQIEAFAEFERIEKEYLEAEKKWAEQMTKDLEERDGYSKLDEHIDD